MRFKREVEVVNFRKQPKDLAKFLKDSSKLGEFLDAIESKRTIEGVYDTCLEYLKFFGGDEYERRTDEYVKWRFYDRSTRYFITFFIYWD